MYDFAEWEALHVAEIMEAEKVLSTVIGDTQGDVEYQMTAAEGLYCRITGLLADVDAILDAEMWRLMPIKGMMPEGERHIAVMAKTAGIRLRRDRLKSLTACIEQRVSVCQSKMKMYTAEYRIIERQEKTR